MANPSSRSELLLPAASRGLLGRSFGARGLLLLDGFLRLGALLGALLPSLLASGLLLLGCLLGDGGGFLGLSLQLLLGLRSPGGLSVLGLLGDEEAHLRDAVFYHAVLDGESECLPEGGEVDSAPVLLCDLLLQHWERDSFTPSVRLQDVGENHLEVGPLRFGNHGGSCRT